MKGSIRDLIGKTITGVIAKAGGPVRQQVFLVFSDDTWFEFYSSERLGYSGTLSTGGADDVRNYMSDVQRIVIDAAADDRESGSAARDAA